MVPLPRRSAPVHAPTLSLARDRPCRTSSCDSFGAHRPRPDHLVAMRVPSDPPPIDNRTSETAPSHYTRARPGTIMGTIMGNGDQPGSSLRRSMDESRSPGAAVSAGQCADRPCQAVTEVPSTGPLGTSGSEPWRASPRHRPGFRGRSAGRQVITSSLEPWKKPSI